MNTQKIIFGLLASSLLSFSAVAQDDTNFGPTEGDWELTLGGSGSSNQDFDAGAGGFSGSLGYFLGDSLEVGVRQSMNFSDFGDSTWSASTRLAVDYHFDLNRFQPFVGANAGIIYGDNVDETGMAGLEAGIKYYVLEKTFIFGMAEYDWFFDDASSADDTFDDGQFAYSLGIGFNF